MTTVNFRQRQNSPEQRIIPLRQTPNAETVDIRPFLAPRLQSLLVHLSGIVLSSLEEIRLRQEKVLLLRVNNQEYTITLEGSLTENLEIGSKITREDIAKTLQIISQNSIYALEEELRNGFITLPGGHRVGLVGQSVLEKGQIKTIKHIGSLNFRIGRQIIGAADPVIPYLIERQTGRIYHTLLVSPPQGGKTTLLRDIVRQLSDGVFEENFAGVNVGLVDERSELAGCFEGIPQKNIGSRTDVLDRCPKAQGMQLLLRSMSPQVIVSDEIGRPEDVNAIEDALNAGVTVITTVHGSTLKDLNQRPVMQKLMAKNIFERIIWLGRSKGVGTVEAITDGPTGQNIFFS